VSSSLPNTMHLDFLGQSVRPQAFSAPLRAVTMLSCLVLSCFLRVHPPGGLFLAHAEAGLHCTVQSIRPPWAGCSGLMHLNHLGALCGSDTCIARPRPLVLSCNKVSLECTLQEGFFWRTPKQAYTVPCSASHPHGQGAQVLCT